MHAWHGNLIHCLTRVERPKGLPIHYHDVPGRTKKFVSMCQKLGEQSRTQGRSHGVCKRKNHLKVGWWTPAVLTFTIAEAERWAHQRQVFPFLPVSRGSEEGPKQKWKSTKSESIVMGSACRKRKNRYSLWHWVIK